MRLRKSSRVSTKDVFSLLMVFNGKENYGFAFSEKDACNAAFSCG